MSVCYHIRMFYNMLSYTPVLQRNICKDNIHNPLYCKHIKGMNLQGQKKKTAQLLNVSATYGQMHSLLQEHFKFHTSLTTANAHHMLLLQLLLQQQAVLVISKHVCFSFHDEW